MNVDRSSIDDVDNDDTVDAKDCDADEYNDDDDDDDEDEDDRDYDIMIVHLLLMLAYHLHMLCVIGLGQAWWHPQPGDQVACAIRGRRGLCAGDPPGSLQAWDGETQELHQRRDNKQVGQAKILLILWRKLFIAYFSLPWHSGGCCIFCSQYCDVMFTFIC